MYDLIVEDATIVSGHARYVADVCIEDGRIAHIGSRAAGRAREHVNGAGHVLMPGVIDGHVHFRSPGHPHKEDWESGSRAAASGGVTTVLDMPNTSPPTLTRASWDHKRGLAAENSRVNFGIWVGASAGNLDAINELMDSGDACGIKVFMGASTGPLLVDDRTLVALFETTRGLLGVHAEDEALLVALRGQFEGDPSPDHNAVRPPAAAAAAVKRLIDLVEAHHRAVHICHVSTAVELELLTRTRGVLPISTEACPHHLVLSADMARNADTATFGNRIKVNPPVRSEADRRALWAGVNQDLIDTIGSDHAPHLLSEKSQPYWSAPSGMPGVETTLPLLLTAVRNRQLSLERVVQLCCEEPARVFGLKRKGTIAVGQDADFLLLADENAPLHALRASDMHTRVGWSPFEGIAMVPRPQRVYVGGRLVAANGAIVGDDVRGALVRPGDAAASASAS